MMYGVLVGNGVKLGVGVFDTSGVVVRVIVGVVVGVWVTWADGVGVIVRVAVGTAAAFAPRMAKKTEKIIPPTNSRVKSVPREKEKRRVFFFVKISFNRSGFSSGDSPGGTTMKRVGRKNLSMLE